MEKLIALVAVLALFALLFRYELSADSKTAYLLDRWTGELDWIIATERHPVKQCEKDC